MHADTLGWIAAALMVATFSCREARLLRPLALATNVSFISYGVMASLPPVLVLHLLLMPINLWRCAQAYGVGAKALGDAAARSARMLCTVALASLPLLAGCGDEVDEVSGAPPASTSPSGPSVRSALPSTAVARSRNVASLLPRLNAVGGAPSFHAGDQTPRFTST